MTANSHIHIAITTDAHRIHTHTCTYTRSHGKARRTQTVKIDFTPTKSRFTASFMEYIHIDEINPPKIKFNLEKRLLLKTI